MTSPILLAAAGDFHLVVADDVVADTVDHEVGSSSREHAAQKQADHYR